MKDGIDLVNGLRKKIFSYEELLDDITKKVTQMNPELNAFVTFEPKQAIQTYKNTSASMQPLGGLPFPLKMLGQEKKDG